MAANVLNSPEAIQMSVFVVRAFIKMREALISRSELERRLLRIENVLLSHDESIRELYDQIRRLLLHALRSLLSSGGGLRKQACLAVALSLWEWRRRICDGDL